MKRELPVCAKCGEPVLGGQVVEKQGGPHVLCSDPDMTRHRRLFRVLNPTEFQIGYVDDEGRSVWL